ncbi:hypothetical protein KKE78_02755 [Patescibacteria group bacterium]|nr:hypothetical protein [Patescibacteria group bacterium]
MRIAIVCSNFVSITKNVKKGTEIFDYIFIDNLVKSDKNIDITSFASGDSNLPVKIESINHTLMEKSFSASKMAEEYLKVYNKIIKI